MFTKLTRISTCKSLFNLCKINKSGKNTAAARSLSIASPKLEEKKVNVDGVGINYLKTGSGAHPVLLLPGAVGTIWTDFKPQIEGLDKNKFTIVAWDPPGCGKSRPPDREFADGFFERDAEYAHDLMKTLGFAKFSLVGWSDGGITSIILAANFPQSVQKMVALGSNAFIMPHEMQLYLRNKNIDSWSERMRAPLIAVYGEEYLRKIFSAWTDSMDRIFKNKKGNICISSLAKVKCPTLIIHGKKDVLVDESHPLHLNRNIPNSRLKYFEKGAHNLHLRYPEEFNKMITEFLSQ